MTTRKTKHIDIRYHFITELVNNKAVEIQYCPVEDMLANVLTKLNLSTALHITHAGRMLSGTYEPLPI
jgi:hypothetical protein